MKAYCFKCRTKREVNNPQHVSQKNGRSAARGACQVCGTRVFCLGGAESKREQTITAPPAGR